MRARYVDLPLEKLAHPIALPHNWIYWRGRCVNIEPHAWPGPVINATCNGPFFAHIGEYASDGRRILACIHVIELEADAEAIEQAMAEVGAA